MVWKLKGVLVGFFGRAETYVTDRQPAETELCRGLIRPRSTADLWTPFSSAVPSLGGPRSYQTANHRHKAGGEVTGERPHFATFNPRKEAVTFRPLHDSFES